MVFSFHEAGELKVCKSILELNKTPWFYSLTVYEHLGKCIGSTSDLYLYYQLGCFTFEK